MDFDNYLSDQNLPALRKDGAGSDQQILLTTEAEPSQALRVDKIDNGGDSGIARGEGTRVAAGAQGGVDVQEVIIIESWYEDLEIYDKSEGAIIVVPTTRERFFWTDPITTLKREIWRPGDGDGDRMADYFEKPGPTTPLEQRWRFYQSRTGAGPVKRQKNEPPKYVILDDRATQEVLVSDIPRTHIAKYWPHDFGGNGSIRARRPHRGRGAIGDFEASGKDRFHFAIIANRKHGERYYFAGEANYQPVIWNTNDYRLAIGVFKPEIKKLTSPLPKKELKWNQHGHNQFTPKSQLVKFGAPHKGETYARPKDKPHDPIGGVRGGRNQVQPLVGSSVRSPAPSAKLERVEPWRSDTRGSTGSEREDIFVSEKYEGRDGAKRRRLDAASAYGEAGEDEETDAYITYLETCVVESKVITDDQNAQIETLKRQLSEAKKTIEALEAEVEELKQG